MNNLNKIAAISLLAFACFMAPSCKASAEGTDAEVTLHIECEVLPEKTAYHVSVDNELITDGIKVVAEYSDGSSKDVTSECIYEGFDSSAVTAAQTITVWYEEEGELYTTEFEISVYAELLSIQVELESEENFVISRGEELDLSQIKVLAAYDDGSEKYVDGWELAGFRNRLIGLNQEVAIEYNENGTTCSDSIFVDVLYKFSDEPDYLPEGTDGTIGTEGRYVYFGDYPQSLKDSEVEILEDRSIEVGVNTYYLGSDGYYYAPVEKSDGTSYYLVQPMKWRILSETCTGTTDEGDNISGKLLLAEEIYTSSRFADPTGTNVYSESVVRQYLNHDFIETAFTSSAREFMIKPELNNGIHSGGPFPVLEEEVASNIRTDKVFILSMADVSNPDYGFGGPTVEGGRQRYPTNYIVKVGVHSSTTADGKVKAWWLLRTPYGIASNGKPATYGVNSSGTLINEVGEVTQHPIYNGHRPGIVPAVVIR